MKFQAPAQPWLLQAFGEQKSRNRGGGGYLALPAAFKHTEDKHKNYNKCRQTPCDHAARRLSRTTAEPDLQTRAEVHKVVMEFV